MPLSAAFRFPFSAAAALLEARRHRLHPGDSGMGWIDRQICRARRACRAEILRLHCLVN